MNSRFNLSDWALEHRSLAGIDECDVPCALVYGCAADVFASTEG